MTIQSEIIAYLRWERELIEPWRAAKELARMARLTALHEERLMAKCTPESEYIDAMAAMVRSGELLGVDGKVRLTPKAKVEPKQGELF